MDLALARLDSFDAYLFSCSYNIVFAILVLAAQSLSPSLWLRRDSLNIRHRPFPSQPFVELELITDSDELYRWFGLDISTWYAGFTDYEAIYDWLVMVSPASALSDAWDRIASGRMDNVKLEYKRFYTRVDGVPDFIAWLKRNWTARSSKHELETAAVSVTLSKVDQSAIPFDEAKSSADTAGRIDTVTEPEVPLDAFASRLLIDRGQAGRYAEMLDLRRREVEKIAAAQERKRTNRVRAAEQERAGIMARIAEAAIRGSGDREVCAASRDGKSVSHDM